MGSKTFEVGQGIENRSGLENVPSWKIPPEIDSNKSESRKGGRSKKRFVRFLALLVLLPLLCASFINSPLGPLVPTNSLTKPLDIGEKTIPDSKISVWGWPDFIIKTKQALLLLEEKDQAGIRKANKYIKKIVYVTAGSGIDVRNGVFKVGDRSAFSSSDQRKSSIWFASIIVHDATHAELYSQGKAYEGQTAELTCLNSQLETLKKLNADASTIHYISNIISNPKSNPYWESPYRNW